MSRQTPFNESHRILYGVEPIERSLNGAISVVQCQFCVHLGREKREGPVVKRQRTKNTQLFKFPFRSESYKNHLESQHTDDWKKYQLLAVEAKKKFFKEMDTSGIRSYVETDRDLLRFTISQPAIVDVIIGDLFFLPEQYEVGGESEAIIKTNAMKLFKLQEDGSYVITIKNPLRFNLAIEHVSVGLSFRQTAAVITQHRNACKNPKLAGLNDHMVGQFVRRCCHAGHGQGHQSSVGLGFFIGSRCQHSFGCSFTRPAHSCLSGWRSVQPPPALGAIL